MSDRLEKLPKDWRVALAVVVLTLGALAAVEQWVISVAKAQDAPQRAAIDRMAPMVEELYTACVADGRCEGKVRVK